MPTRLQAKLFPHSPRAGWFTERDHPVRVGPAPPDCRPSRHSTDGEVRAGDANEERADPLGRTLEHELRQFGAINEPDRRETDRELAGGRSEVDDDQPALVFGKDGSGLTQDRCERIVISEQPSTRKRR